MQEHGAALRSKRLDGPHGFGQNEIQMSILVSSWDVDQPHLGVTG